MQFNHLYEKYCTELKNIGRYRELPVQYNNVIDFSSNDYLGLSKDKEIIELIKNNLESLGIGSTGSRLLSGNRAIFENLEKQIAINKKTQCSLIFNSGFQANYSVLSCLLNKNVLGEKAIVFFDKLNHASLYEAVFSSEINLIRYNHNDMNHLEYLLSKHQNNKQPKFIVCETLYGMDGDIVQINEIIKLSKKYNAFLYLDEAHATGILGENGYGLSTSVNMTEIPNIIMGTFSKSIGVFGAYVACNETIKNYLINKCSGFIYSTSLPPIIIAAVNAAWNKIKNLNKERTELFKKAENLRNQLKNLGFNTGLSSTHIIPIILNDEKVTLKSKNFLKDNGIIISAIRPPSVPLKTSRLKIALTLKHTEENIEKLLSVLRKL